LMYSQIALVRDEFKMISAHDLHRLNALLTPCGGDLWRYDIRTR